MFLYYAVMCFVLILCCEVLCSYIMLGGAMFSLFSMLCSEALCSYIMLGGAMFSMLCYAFYVVL